MGSDDDWKALSDDALVTVYWYSDILDAKEFKALMDELDRRGIDPHKE